MPIELENPSSRYLFRVKVGTEKGWLIKSFNWASLLAVKSDGLHYRVLRPRAQSVRVTLATLFSTVSSAVLILAIWRYLNGYFLATPFNWILTLVWVISSIPIFFSSFFFGIVGLLYFIDFLTLRLQARYSTDIAILRLKEVHMGRFRHTLRVAVEREIIPLNFKGGEFLLTVAATKHRLRTSLDLLKTMTPG